MCKKILLLTLSCYALLGVSAQEVGNATLPAEISFPTAQEPILMLNGQNLRVQYAQGEVLEVFNLTGVKITSLRIETNDYSVSLPLTRGIYIFRLGKIVRKIAVA